MALLSILAAVVSGCRNEQPTTTVAPTPESPPADLAGEALADWFIDRGRYEDALPLVLKAVEARSDADPLIRAEALMMLGMVHDSMGAAARAIPPLTEAWQLLDEHEAPLVIRGACLDALGLAFHSAGELEKAEDALKAAIDYRRAASPEGDEPWVEASRVHLGRLYLTMARFEEAEQLLRGALKSAIANDAVAQVLASRYRHVGTYDHTVGNYAAAVEAFGKARESAEAVYGPDSDQTAAIIGDLGLAQLRSGDLDAAEKSLLTSHEVLETDASRENLAAYYLFVRDAKKALELFGENDEPEDAVGLNNLGSAYLLEGRSEEAMMALGKARDMAKEKLDEHHPLHVQILQNIACAHADAGESEKALAAAREASSAADSLLRHLLAFGSEAQKLAFRRTSDPLSQLCSFGASPEEIANAILVTKGVVLDSMLAKESEFKARRWEEVATALDEDSALVEYVVYQQYAGAGKWTRRYGALVLAGGSDPVWVPLKEERRLVSLLRDLRAHMEAEESGSKKSEAFLSIDSVLEGLYRFAWNPVKGALPGTVQRVYFAPDGQLNFVPFAALRSDAKFLCEEIETAATVTSGRALIGSPSGSKTQRMVIAAIEKYSGKVIPWPGPASGIGSDLWESLADFGNLPGVRIEAEEIAKIDAEHASTLHDVGEKKLRAALDSPEVFHFCGHAFFNEGAGNPMARSGLVLGGLRETLERFADGEEVSELEDNILFAGEIASLPLEGTYLVALSACDTGLGVSQTGEGVLGLRRGFQLAGARNILMTLWPIADASAADFVTVFYRDLSNGYSPAEAVWNNQRSALSEGADDLRSTVFSVAAYQLTTRPVPGSSPE